MRRRAVAAVLGLGLLLGGCATSETDEPDRGGQAPMSNARLDSDGIEQIEQTGAARLDLRDRELTREEVGLPPGRLGPIVGRPGGDTIDLTLVGPEGEETVSTATFGATFLSTRDTATNVTWFESYETEADAFEALDAATERWGLRQEAIANWRETLALGGEQEVSLPLGVSPTGLVTQVTVRGEQGAGQTHQWAVLLRPRYYTPEALDAIRRTGDTPRS